jgi:hypothetical protein
MTSKIPEKSCQQTLNPFPPNLLRPRFDKNTEEVSVPGMEVSQKIIPTAFLTVVDKV